MITRAALDVNKRSCAESRRSLKLQVQIDKSSAAVAHAKRVAANVREQERLAVKAKQQKIVYAQDHASEVRQEAIDEKLKPLISIRQKREQFAKTQQQLEA